MRIRISWPSGEVYANLEETPTSKALMEALPIESRANTWGDEVYFSIPVNVPKEPNAKQVVDPGTVCYWVEGTSLALPFGPTPISQGNECRLAAEVNILGKLESDPFILGNVQVGDRIEVDEA
jgi:hypothetical protein